MNAPTRARVTRVCPHCKATILASAAVCPSCRHHLRFDPAEAALRAAEFRLLKIPAEAFTQLANLAKADPPDLGKIADTVTNVLATRTPLSSAERSIHR